MTTPPAQGQDVSFAALRDLAVAVAEEAAELVRERRTRDVEVSDTKSSSVDVVTEVDHAAEALIYRRLMDARPGDGFVGEEGASAESTTGVAWIVDPIDGTVNFLYGLPQYSVSIAATRDDEVVAGAVVAVQAGEVFAATLGGGATCNGRPLHVREVVPLEQRLVVTGFSYVREVRARQGQAVAALLPAVRDIRRLGSAALDLCWVGAGRVDGYVEEGLNRWDMAAGGLVATEAGARLETRDGAGGRPCVVCAPEGGFDDLMALVERCGFLAGSA